MNDFWSETGTPAYKQARERLTALLESVAAGTNPAGDGLVHRSEILAAVLNLPSRPEHFRKVNQELLDEWVCVNLMDINEMLSDGDRFDAIMNLMAMGSGRARTLGLDWTWQRNGDNWEQVR